MALRLFKDPSPLDWDLSELSPSFMLAFEFMPEASGWLELAARFAKRMPVSAISLFISSAMSGECDLTLVCSKFAFAIEIDSIMLVTYIPF